MIAVHSLTIAINYEGLKLDGGEKVQDFLEFMLSLLETEVPRNWRHFK